MVSPEPSGRCGNAEEVTMRVGFGDPVQSRAWGRQSECKVRQAGGCEQVESLLSWSHGRVGFEFIDSSNPDFYHSGDSYFRIGAVVADDDQSDGANY